MASITLDRAWLHLASDLSVYERFWTAEPEDLRTKIGEVRAYAGGRLRSISRTVRRKNLGLRLLDVTAAQVETLEDWQGELLMYRDEAGRLLFGVFFDLDVDTYPFGQGHEVAFSFQQVSHSIEVE